MDVDLINGPILKSLLIFSVPLFISTIFQQLYGFYTNEYIRKERLD